MNVLVVGAHFYNKGAHLMMIAVLEELKKQPDINLYLSPTTGTENQIRELGYGILDYPLKHVADEKSFNAFLNYGGILKHFKKKFRGELNVAELDAVLDISGFAFSDQWGSRLVENVNSLITFVKKKGAKYIFMPQAFGPFSSDHIKSEMNKTIEGADLIFARDKVSYETLKDVSPSKNILQSPDITISLHNNQISDEVDKYGCIVPNERMVDQGREFWPEGKYMEYLKSSIQKLSERGLKVYILLHDKGMGDVKLVNSLKEDYFMDNQLVSVRIEENPMKLKNFLGGAQLVIGSRFHALVSALSQDVPSMALGWSHKYNMLFEEYGVEKLSFDRPDNKRFQESLNELLAPEGSMTIQETIINSNKVLQEKNKEMWSKVLKELRS